MTVQKSFSQVIFQSDSQLVVNYINRKMGVPKDIVNLVEYVKYLLTRFSDSGMEYCKVYQLGC